MRGYNSAFLTENILKTHGWIPLTTVYGRQLKAPLPEGGFTLQPGYNEQQSVLPTADSLQPQPAATILTRRHQIMII